MLETEAGNQIPHSFGPASFSGFEVLHAYVAAGKSVFLTYF